MEAALTGVDRVLKEPARRAIPRRAFARFHGLLKGVIVPPLEPATAGE
jgi:hypothetical protein